MSTAPPSKATQSGEESSRAWDQDGSSNLSETSVSTERLGDYSKLTNFSQPNYHQSRYHWQLSIGSKRDDALPLPEFLDTLKSLQIGFTPEEREHWRLHAEQFRKAIEDLRYKIADIFSLRPGGGLRSWRAYNGTLSDRRTAPISTLIAALKEATTAYYGLAG